ECQLFLYPFAFFASLTSVSLALMSWNQVLPFGPFGARFYMSVTVMNDMVYLLGGMPTYYIVLSDVWASSDRGVCLHLSFLSVFVQLLGCCRYCLRRGLVELWLR